MFRKIIFGAAVLAAMLVLGCSSENGGEAGTGGDAGMGGSAGSGGTGGAGGSAGSGGTGGAGGSGGATEGCTLGTQWENMGFWGAETLGYGNVVLLQSPRDGSLWQVVSRTQRGSSDQVDIALFQSLDGGTNWNEVTSWDFPVERSGWHSDAAIADDGTIFVVLREFTLVDGAASDRYVKLLRYAPGGSLREAGTFNPEGSADTRSVSITTRGGEAWFIAFNATPFPPDYHIVKYENGTLESFDIVRYLNETNEIYLRDLVVAPNGKLWTVGQGRDGEGGRWFATIWEEGESGFALLFDWQEEPEVAQSDTMMALAFDEDGRFWASYYTMPRYPVLDRRWRAGYGMVDAPETSFALNDDFSLDPEKVSDTGAVVVHPSGVVFTGGHAIDADDWQWGVVRMGTTGGFEISDKFTHESSGEFRSVVSSLLVEEDGDVWVAYMSRPMTSWFPKWTTLKKLACVR